MTIIRGKKNIVFPLSNHDGWIQDSEGTHLLDVRGWGHFRKFRMLSVSY